MSFGIVQVGVTVLDFAEMVFGQEVGGMGGGMGAATLFLLKKSLSCLIEFYRSMHKKKLSK